MKWLIILALITMVGDWPQSRTVIPQEVSKPLDDLVPVLDSLSIKLTDLSTKIEKL